jgi:hypothetical protein
MSEDPAAQFRRIQAKEAELQEREKKLRTAHVHLDEERPKNFPPFCPFMFHDISADIPIIAQWTVRLAFIGQFAFYVTLIWNVIASFTVGGLNSEEGESKVETGQTIIFAILILLLGIPCAFKINYQRLYNQARKPDISMLFFGLQGLFIVAIAVLFAGFPDTGCMGIVIAIDALASKAGGFCKFAIIISAVLAGICLAWQCVLFGKLMILFKATGAYAPENPAAPASSI